MATMIHYNSYNNEPVIVSLEITSSKNWNCVTPATWVEINEMIRAIKGTFKSSVWNDYVSTAYISVYYILSAFFGGGVSFGIVNSVKAAKIDVMA